MLKFIFIIVFIALAVVVAMVVTRNGNNTKYSIDYCGYKDLFKGAKDRYKEGENVVIYYPYTLIDTSYRFYLNGVPIDYSFADNNGYKLTFVMSPYDAKLQCITKNDMEYTPPQWQYYDTKDDSWQDMWYSKETVRRRHSV